MRDLGINKLVLASNNEGKVREFRQLFAPYDIRIIPAGEFPYPEPVENGATFVENAEIKSRYYALKTSMPALSDDSGLEVGALGGAPGIYSADWAGSPRNFYDAMNRVEKELNDKGIKTRQPLGQDDMKELQCNFICVLSLCYPDGRTHNFEGRVFGHLTFPVKGEAGFGYDPCFTPLGHDKTFAEMRPEEKYSISHRAEAFKKLAQYING